MKPHSDDNVWVSKSPLSTTLDAMGNCHTQAEAQSRISFDEIVSLKIALDEHSIVAITDPRGLITYVNDKFCTISKYSRAELLGQDHRLINSGHHSKDFMRNLWMTIAQGGIWKGEICNRAKNGTFYWVDTTIMPFLTADGKLYQFVSIRTDITARKMAEEKILKFNDELARQVQIRTAELQMSNQELEAFSYSVSHDLRAPIRHINGYLELLRQAEGANLSAEGGRHLQRIGVAARQMSELIDDLLQFSRIGRAQVQKSKVNLDRLIEETIHGLRPETTGRDVAWKKEELPEVDADPALLRQVFVNLLSNAVKYSRPRDRAEIEIGWKRDQAAEIVLYVRDNGVGFDMKYAHKLFGVFQRLHSADEFEGTGIGLANVKRIIARHGGRAWAESELDQGAVFYFSLPLPQPSQPEPLP